MEEKLLKSDEEWRLQLDPESYYVLREKEQSVPSQANSMIIMKKAFMFVKHAARLYTSQKPSLTVGVAGRVFMMALNQAPLKRKQITVTVWFAGRLCVLHAAGIWVTFLMTAPNPRACDIA